MTSRPVAIGIAVGLAAAVLIAVATARGATGPADRTLAAIQQEFGTGRLAGCMAAIAYRESRYNPRAANWTDRHADGSRGSFGAFQVGALWRRPGESVAAFARRMYDPRANAALAHQLYRRFGLQPWGNRC
jgi:hypothetical protein